MASNFLSHLTPPSYKTWVRVYHSSWEHVIRFRGESQHAKCDVCEKFKAFRRQSVTESDAKVVGDSYCAHLNTVLSDRRADAIWRQNAMDYMKGLNTSKDSSWLVMTVDGMDCAKFSVPLNIAKCKEFSKMERPEMKLTVVVTDGICESYYLMDQAVSATANLDLTLISEELLNAFEHCQHRGVQFPVGLRVHADNAPSEMKNQLAMKFGSWLLHLNVVESVVFSFFMTGHSHGLPDQRFSEVRFELASQNVLESPMDFINAIENVKPRQGRSLQATYRGDIAVTLSIASAFDGRLYALHLWGIMIIGTTCACKI